MCVVRRGRGRQHGRGLRDDRMPLRVAGRTAARVRLAHRRYVRAAHHGRGAATARARRDIAAARSAGPAAWPSCVPSNARASRSTVGSGCAACCATSCSSRPSAVRTFELRGFRLRFTGAPRDETALRRGLAAVGCAADAAGVLAARGPGRAAARRSRCRLPAGADAARLAVWAAIAALLLGYLAHVYVGERWWARAGTGRSRTRTATRRLRPRAPARRSGGGVSAAASRVRRISGARAVRGRRGTFAAMARAGRRCVPTSRRSSNARAPRSSTARRRVPRTGRGCWRWPAR